MNYAGSYSTKSFAMASQERHTRRLYLTVKYRIEF